MYIAVAWTFEGLMENTYNYGYTYMYVCMYICLQISGISLFKGVYISKFIRCTIYGKAIIDSIP